MSILPAGLSRSHKTRMGGAALVSMYLLSSVYIVRSSQQAIVLRLGSPLETPLLPGLHFAPRFLESVLKVEVTRTYTLQIGLAEGDGQEASAESRVVGVDDERGQGSWVTGDTNVLALRLVAQYQVQDPLRYISAGPQAAGLVQRAVEAALTDVAGQLPVDELLTRNRLAATDTVRLRAQERLLAYGTGIQLVSLGLRSIDPPGPVVAAFQDVQDARSDRERLINEARGFANETLPTARGEAATLLSTSLSTANERVEKAKGDVARFDDVRRAALLAPAFMRDRLYLETMEKVLPRMRVLVIDGKGSSARFRVIEPPKGLQ